MPRRRHPRPGRVGDYWLSQPWPDSGIWYRTWYDRGPPRRLRRASLGTEDFQAAFDALVAWVAGHATQPETPAADTLLESVWLRYWEQHGKHLASAEATRIALGYWSELLPEARVAELTPTRQRAFVEALRSRGHSNGYIARILTVGRAALNRAYRYGELDRAPYILPVPAGPPRERRLSLEEMARFLLQVRTAHLATYCAVALATLARPEAILELQRFQLDFATGLVHLNPAGRPQTKKYRPVVPMGATLRRVLELGTAAHVVAWHGRPVASVKTAFRDTAARAGLPGVTPYTLRHTMATELRRRGVPPWEVAGMLGHKSAGYATTEIYAKYDPTYLGQAGVALEQYFNDLRAEAGRLRSGCDQLRSLQIPEKAAKVLIVLVGAAGIEPATTTMSTQGESHRSRA